MTWVRHTPEEDARIIELREHYKYSFSSIAEALGRTYHYVWRRYDTLKAVQASGASLYGPRRNAS